MTFIMTIKFVWSFRKVSFKLILIIDGGGISSEFALRWMLLDLTSAITWANVDPDLRHHMTSQGHND